MSETPEELRELIARARNAGPGPQRLADVRARLESQLGPLDAPRASPVVPGPTAALGSMRTLGVAAVVAVIALGLWLGARSPAAEPSTEPTTERAARASEHPSGVAPAPEPAHALDAPLVPSTTAPAEEEPATHPIAVDEPVASRRVPRPSLAPVAPEVELDPASSLREEIALLDRALRASEAGDPARARAALDEHRSRFPSGTLTPERNRMLAELPHEHDEGSAAPSP